MSGGTTFNQKFHECLLNRMTFWDHWLDGEKLHYIFEDTKNSPIPKAGTIPNLELHYFSKNIYYSNQKSQNY